MDIAATTLAASVAVTSLVSTVGAVADAGDRCHTSVVAHRGYHENHAENTVLALHAAVNRGAKVVEGDIRVAENGDLMLIHDGTLVRTTNARGFVRHRTGPQIRRLRTTDRHRVPYVVHFLRFVRRHPNVRGVLEVKSDRAVELLDRRVSRFGLGRQLTISSMSVHRLKATARLMPHAQHQIISARRMQARHLKRFADWVSLPAAELYPGYVDRLHARGIRIQLRATQTRAAWDKAMRLGVDAISTNEVPELVDRCRARTWRRVVSGGARGGS